MNHGRRIERAAAAALALAALVCAAISTSAAFAAPQGLVGRIAFTPSGTLIQTAEGDGTRAKDLYARAGEWAPLALRDPAYSPDGRKLAFAGANLDGSRIGVLDSDRTGAPATLAQSGPALHELGRPAWSADGKTVAFAAAEGLFAVPAAGGAPAKIVLPATYRDPADPAYSPDDRLLAFTALDAANDRRVYLKDLDGGAITQLTFGGARQDSPAFAADGASVAYVDTPLAPGGGLGLPQLAVRPVGGGAPDILWTNQVEPGRMVSGRPAYAPDGTRIAFTVTKPGDPACAGELTIVDTDGPANPRSIECSTGTLDWAVRTAQGVTKLASSLPGSTNETGDAAAADASISADGRYLFFSSKATNLAAGVNDANGKTDIFRRDLASGRTTLASLNRDGKASSGEADLPISSADGRYVLFRSSAADLTTSGTVNYGSAVFVKNVENGLTLLISRRQGKPFESVPGDNRPLAMNRAASRFLFSSTGSDVVADQGEDLQDRDADLFVTDTTSNQTNAVSVKAGSLTASGNGAAGAALMSEDGMVVVFESTATDLVEGFVDHNGDAPNLYRRDLRTNTTTLLDGAKGSATEGAAGTPQLRDLSPDGQTVLFTQTAPDLVDGFADGNGDAPDLYVRRAATTLVSGAGGSATQGADGAVSDALLGGDRIVFTSAATDLNPAFTVSGDQVWTRTTGPAVLVTRGARLDHGANKPSRLIDASRDGAHALISSAATDLTAPLQHHDDTPTLYRVATADFDAEPLSARGDDSADRTPQAKRGALSADGLVAAYTSAASNLVDGLIDGDGDGEDAYAWMERSAARRDPIAPTVTITTPQGDRVYRQDQTVLAEYTCEDEGPSGLKDCDGPVLQGQAIDTSEIGTFEFKVTATDNAGNTRTKRVAYRVAAANRKLSLASRTAAAGRLEPTGNGSSYSPALSADGRYLVFASDATDLVPGFIDGNGIGTDIYRRDLQTGTTELVSAGLPRTGDDGRPRGVNAAAGIDPAPFMVSPDGRYVLFESAATDITPEHNVPAGAQLWLRDMQEHTTKLVTHQANGRAAGEARPDGYAFSRDGGTVVFSTTAKLVADDANSARDVYAYAVATGAVTLVSVDSGGRLAAAGLSDAPQVSADGRRVVFASDATNLLSKPLAAREEHLYWRDLTTGETKLVDHEPGKALEPADHETDRARITADGAVVLFESQASNVTAGYAGSGTDRAMQLYRRDMTTDGTAVLVTSAHDNPRRGTGGTIAASAMTPDGKLVIWSTLSHDVIPNFVDHNDEVGWGPEEDLFMRRFDGATAGPAALAFHGRDGANHGSDFLLVVHGISADGRFVAVYLPTRVCDCNLVYDDVARLDIKRNRLNNVVSSANAPIEEVVASDDAKRIAVGTYADNLLTTFEDRNGPNAADVYTWYDAPPTAAADTRTTASLKLAFDASESQDSDGRIEFFSWSFGDGATGAGEKTTHVYADEGNYTVTLTIEDDGGNEVVHTFEVVAIKGILTTGTPPIDFIGIDKHLRCSVVRDGPLLADGGGSCGTFVALGGKTYGPPELIEGTEDYTPVGQELSSAGDVTTLVTTVALGDTGVRVRQTDAYTAGADFYRTDVELLNAGDAGRDAIVYRAARCEIGADSGRRSIHDAGTGMAGCDGAARGGRLLAAWLPLSPGARRDAASAEAVYGRIKDGKPPADTCACGTQPDPAAAIGWPVTVPANGRATLGSLAAFGPDGSIPATLTLKADKDTVQPLDDNAFTVTLRNPNAKERDVSAIALDSAGAWDVTPHTTTGLTTAEPSVAGTVASWNALKLAGHASGQLRFGVTHRSGRRTATTTATPAGGAYANLAAAGLADLPTATATVVARALEGAKPNTAITSGPTGAITNRDPEFKLESSKDEGVSYECRFGDAPWAPCEGNPHRPGPLADGPYVLEARAVDVYGADETPARRSFVVDTAAPATVLSTAPRGTIGDPRPAFHFSASEAGARFECRLEGPGRAGAWFACETPYRPAALADGDWTFAVKAIDAAGNEDPTPATATFRIDTTPPVTVIDGVTGKVVGATRNGASAARASGGSGGSLALGGDGAATVAVACPADGPACDGTVGLAAQPPTASAARARPTVPDNAVILARAEFSARPGETVRVRLPLSMTVRNTVERVGRMAVFTTLDFGTGRPIRGGDVLLTPDPRTVRLRDAGRTIAVKGGTAELRLSCPPGHAGACTGSVKLGTRDSAKFSVKAGRNTTLRVRISKQTKRGKELRVLVNTRLAPAKRLTLTLRAQEARR